jgi:hypothetical protein
MSTEDEIIRAYEAELRSEPPASGHRGFWIVVGTLLVVGIFLVVEILANRPLADRIGHAQDTLRRAQAAAESIRTDTGAFSGADARGLAEALPSFSVRAAAEASTGLDELSVAASDRVWAAAVQARPGACFYLRLEIGTDPRYGSGTECTAHAALFASEPRW